MAYANDKGSRFEQKLVKLFSEYWGIQFGRSVGSGSYRGTNREYVGLGDLQPPVNNDFPFIIEAKNHEDWTLDQLFLGKGKVKEFWEQVIGDAEGTEEILKAPLLAFTRNYMEDLILIPYEEEIFTSILSNKQPVSRLPIIDYNKITDTTTTYDTLLTTFSGFSSVDKEVYTKLFYDKDWKQGRVETTFKEKTETETAKDMDSLISSLSQY